MFDDIDEPPEFDLLFVDWIIGGDEATGGPLASRTASAPMR